MLKGWCSRCVNYSERARERVSQTCAHVAWLGYGSAVYRLWSPMHSDLFAQASDIFASALSSNTNLYLFLWIFHAGKGGILLGSNAMRMKSLIISQSEPFVVWH